MQQRLFFHMLLCEENNKKGEKMPLIFMPHPEDTAKGELKDRVDVLMDAAELYKTEILDAEKDKEVSEPKLMVPRDLKVAFNWEEIARVLREIRELPEGNSSDKQRKSELLTKLAEIYEVLRAAKMSKLEAVRLALVSEATHLRSGSSSNVG